MRTLLETIGTGAMAILEGAGRLFFTHEGLVAGLFIWLQVALFALGSLLFTTKYLTAVFSIVLFCGVMIAIGLLAYMVTPFLPNSKIDIALPPPLDRVTGQNRINRL